MEKYTDQIFPVLLGTLSANSDEVVILDIQVLAELCSSTSNQTKREEHIRACIKHLLQLFKEDKKLLHDKMYYIVR